MNKNWQKNFIDWNSNLNLWCISIFMKWGHKMPIWNVNNTILIKDSFVKVKYYIILWNASPLIKNNIIDISQELLVFDTWFSSSFGIIMFRMTTVKLNNSDWIMEKE